MRGIYYISGLYMGARISSCCSLTVLSDLVGILLNYVLPSSVDKLTKDSFRANLIVLVVLIGI